MPVGSEMSAALHSGKAAAETRQLPDSNPFAAGSTPREKVLSTMWRSGYQAGNPMPLVDSQEPQEEAPNGNRG